MESLTRLPSGGNGDGKLEESSMQTMKQQSRKDSSNDQEENAISSILIDGTGREKDTEEFSVLTDPNHGEHSKEMMNVIKGLDQKFELLDRRLSEFHPPQPPQPVVEQPSNQIMEEELEEKTTQIKDLSKTKSRLEEQNKVLGVELSSLKSDLSAEREHLISTRAELEQTKSLNESLKTDLNECMEDNAHLKNEVIPRTERELHNSLEELKKRQNNIKKMAQKLLEYETKMKKLKSEMERLVKETKEEKDHFQTLNQESHRAHEEQELENEKKDQMIKEIQQSLTLAKSELADERSLNDEKMIELQDVLLQVKNMILEKEQLEKQFSDFKHEIVTKNKENNAAVRLVQEEKALLQNRLNDVEIKLKSVSEEKKDALIRLGTSDQREDELFHKLRESDRVRKELHARVMVLIGNIRVFVRVRPPLPHEAEASNAEQIFKYSSESGSFDEKKSSKYGCDDPTKNVLHVKEPFKDRGGLSQRRKKWSFGFDSVFDPSHSQEDLWEATEPLVQCAIDGFNVTLFAYGQTVSYLQIAAYDCILVQSINSVLKNLCVVYQQGSGKTYTMLGDSESTSSQGVIFRSIRKLFEAKARIENLSRGDKAVTMTVELLEIYNEQVRDLLAPKAPGVRGQEASLKICGNKAVGSIQQSVAEEVDVLEILKGAEKRRTVKATSSNATSSRSHLLFTIEYTITSKDGTTQVGKLNVCDLAGSERLAKSGAHIAGGSLLKETKHINLSLSSLSNVIEKLQAGDNNVPFRDSKLTSLLQNSLGGNSKTLCIICCNPLQTHFHETLCSLRFAAKINKVDLKSVQNFSA